MTLSLDALYRPLDEFFRSKFAVTQGPLTQFRLARIPQTLVDTDFILNGVPDANLAQELFSDIVDVIPTLDADGERVSIGLDEFSELYDAQIVGPSQFFPGIAATDAAEREARFEQFVGLRGDAVRRLRENRRASYAIGGTAQYYPSTPHPATWWDKSSSAWISQTFRIVTPPSSEAAASTSRGDLLRLKMDDIQYGQMLETRYLTKPVPTTKSAALKLGMSAISKPQVMRERQFATIGAPREALAVREPIARDEPLTTKHKLAALSIRDRAAFQKQIAAQSETKPVTSTEATISFDFCAVDVKERDWLDLALLINRDWSIPGQAKGALSANDGRSASVIPVGFVAVKNLEIKAPWTAEDIANLATSVQFGPSNFSSTIVDGALRHDDIQIVAWMLQELPQLPPNGA